MDISFKVAIAVSALIHSALFIPICKTFVVDAESRARGAAVIDYVTAGPIAQDPDSVKAGEVKAAVSDVRSKGSVVSTKLEARRLIREEAVLRASPVYANYYQLIRETIRQKLKNYYKTVDAKGDVVLAFILTSSGALTDIDVDRLKSVQDASLIRIATESVKEASPFPPFPKELSVSKMSFDLTISFKKQ